MKANYFRNPLSYWCFGVRYAELEQFDSVWELHFELGPIGTVVLWKQNAHW